MKKIEKILKWLKTGHRYIAISVFIALLLLTILPVFPKLNILYFLIYASCAIAFSLEIRHDFSKNISTFKHTVKGYVSFGLQLMVFSLVAFAFGLSANQNLKKAFRDFDSYFADHVGEYFSGFGSLLLSCLILSIIWLAIWLTLSAFADSNISALVNAVFTVVLGLIHEIIDYIFSFLSDGFFLVGQLTEEQTGMFIRIYHGFSPKEMSLMIINTLYIFPFIICGVTAIVGVIRSYCTRKGR